jgi:tetratricopeptide (TPR) repeat protein
VALPDTPSAYATQSAELVATGLSLHQAGKVGEAAELYVEALRLDPDNAETSHLLGVARLAQQRLSDALPLLARAIELEPANPQYLANMGVALNAAESYERAIAVLDRAIALKPDVAGPYSNRGMAYRSLAQFDEAVASYEQAIRLKPDEAGFHFNLANSLADAARPHEALLAMERALELRPGHPGATAGRITILETLRRYDDALAAAEDAAKRMPRSIDVLASLASILRLTGDVARSIDIQRRILALEPANGAALHGLALARRHTRGDPEVEAFRDAFHDQAAPRRQRTRAGFGYGKALADIGEHALSRGVFVEANAMRRLDHPYSLSRALAVIERIASQFGAMPIMEGAAVETSRRPPIFVVGLPRAGKTTIEMLLSRASGTWAAGELNQLKRVVVEAVPAEVRQEGETLARFEFARLDAAMLRAAAEAYLRYITALAPAGTTVIDTMPTNFMLIGFIRNMMPNARIVHAVRDPLQQAVALFEKCFRRPTYGYTCNLGDLQTYYLSYRRMMALWDRLYPGAIFNANVAELMHDPGRVQELLDFCGLEKSAVGAGFVESEPEAGGLPLTEKAAELKHHAEAYAGDLAGLQALLNGNAANTISSNPAFTELNGW